MRWIGYLVAAAVLAYFLASCSAEARVGVGPARVVERPPAIGQAKAVDVPTSELQLTSILRSVGEGINPANIPTYNAHFYAPFAGAPQPKTEQPRLGETWMLTNIRTSLTRSTLFKEATEEFLPLDGFQLPAVLIMEINGLDVWSYPVEYPMRRQQTGLGVFQYNGLLQISTDFVNPIPFNGGQIRFRLEGAYPIGGSGSTLNDQVCFGYTFTAAGSLIPTAAYIVYDIVPRRG